VPCPSSALQPAENLSVVSVATPSDSSTSVVGEPVAAFRNEANKPAAGVKPTPVSEKLPVDVRELNESTSYCPP
jgi:hypothetical protein